MGKLKKVNRQLQRERELRGWSQAKVAEKLGTTVKRVSMWECGDAVPGRYYQESLIQLFGKNAQELGFLDDGDLGENKNLVPVDEQPYSAACSNYEDIVMPKEESGSNTLKRRKFLRETGHAAVVGTVIVASSEIISTELLDRFQRALRKPAILDSRMLTYLEKRTGEFWQDRHSAALASSDLLSYTLDHFQKMTSILEGSLSPVQRLQLCVIASKAALLIGEIFIDMGQFSQARQFVRTAIQAAQEAGDPALEAIARGRMSLAWTYSENIPMALANVQEARYLAITSADETICSWLAAIEAEAQANLHNCSASLEALNEAERIENYINSPNENYLIRFDRALLRGYQGASFRLLYSPDDASSTIYLEKAQRVLLDSLALLDSTLMQRQPTFLTDLAHTYIQQGEIEEACKCATQAVLGASQIKLQKVVQKLYKLREELRPWQDSQYVKDLDSYLSPLLPLNS